MLLPPNFFESADQIFGADAAAVGAGDVGRYAALVHHYDAGAEGGGLLHGVGDHQGGQVVFRDDALGEADDLVGAFGVEGGGVLVEEEEVGSVPGGH